MDSQEHWDLEIKPKSKLFFFNFAEVWRYRDLVLLFVRRDFVAQYKQTILGPIWHFIQPVLTTIMFLLVFGKIARLSTDGINPILFYMSGITIWNYFSFSLTSVSNTFVQNAAIFGKVYFPRIIIPLSVVISNVIRLGIQFILLLVAILLIWISGQPIGVSLKILWIPLLVLLMAGTALGMGIIVSSITTKYRDFSVLLTFAVQLYMYATPIVYPMSYLQNTQYDWLIRLNPLTTVVEAFRYCLFGAGTFNMANMMYSVSFMIAVLIGGLVLFNRVEKTFVDTV